MLVPVRMSLQGTVSAGTGTCETTLLEALYLVLGENEAHEAGHVCEGAALDLLHSSQLI